MYYTQSSFEKILSESLMQYIVTSKLNFLILNCIVAWQENCSKGFFEVDGKYSDYSGKPASVPLILHHSSFINVPM